MPTVLVDTNILIYAHDPADPVKQAKAIQVLDHLQTRAIGRLSTQTLGEFFAATTRGKRPLLTVAKASKQIENLTLSWVLFDVTPLVAVEAARGVAAEERKLVGSPQVRVDDLGYSRALKPVAASPSGLQPVPFEMPHDDIDEVAFPRR